MRIEPYDQEIEVELDQEDELVGQPVGEGRRLRREQASRAWPALAKQEGKIEKLKGDHKEALKELETEKATIIQTARKAAESAESGREMRSKKLRDVIVGEHVITQRIDTGADVGEPRMASDKEHEAWEKHTGKQRDAATAKPGATLAERDAKMASTVRAKMQGRTKPASEKLILGWLAKDCHEASAGEREAWLAIATGDGGLLIEYGDGWALRPEDPIVPDDYRPEGAAQH